MGATCVFDLNRQEFSILRCDGVGAPASLQAFSGRQSGRDNPDSTAVAGLGPIPKGIYYIVDRQSGGRLGWLRDLWSRDGWGTSDHTKWFMLWNKESGDITKVGSVQRGSFRLHPIGPMRLSEGCITINDVSGFEKLANALRAHGADVPVPGTSLKAYGVVEVR